MTDAARSDPPPGPGPQVFCEWLAVALAAVALVLLLTFTGATAAGDNLVYNQFLRLHGRAPSDRIVVVAIDDASLAAYGAWPWPRTLHARLLDRLTDAGAAAVGYDVLFIEPDPAGGDAALATALRRSGRAALPVLELSPGDDGQAVKMVRPRAPLTASAARLGQVSLILDGDGVARRFSVLQASGGVCWRHLALALLDIARQGSAAFPNCVPLAQASRHVDGLIATPPQLIPFVGPPNSFRTVSAADLLRGEVPPELIKGRLVLVGATAAGLGDRHMTAAAGGKGAMAGVEIQANILDALMQNVTLITLSNWLIALVSLAPVTGFMAALLWLKPSSNLIVGGGLMALVFAGSAAGFMSGVWFPPLSAAAGLLLAYPLWSWRRLAAASDYLREEISRFDNPVATSPERLPTDALGRQVDVLSRAADQLRSLSRVLGRALQSLPDAAVLVDGDGAITLANAHAEALAGAGAGRLAGSSVRAWLELAVGAAEGARIASALTGEARRWRPPRSMGSNTRRVGRVWPAPMKKRA